MRGIGILELKTEVNDLTIRQYLQKLLLTLWAEGEGFSGKKPFGNSGWEYDLYKPLIRAGVIPGVLDDDGYIDDVDTSAGHAAITEAIKEVFAYSTTKG